MGNETEDRSREEEQVTAASSTDNSGATDTTDNNTSSVQPLQQTEEDTNTGSQEGAHVTGASQTPARELEQVSNQMGINAVAAGGSAPSGGQTQGGTPAPGNSVEDSAPAPTSSRTEGETSTPGNNVEDSAPAPTGSQTEVGTPAPGNSMENEREPAPSGGTNDEENDHEDTETNNTGAPQNPQRTPQQPPGENLTEVLDEVRGDVSDLAANTSSGVRREGNGGEDGGAFHTMKELLDAQKKDAGEEKPSAGGTQGGENKSEFEKLYDGIKKFRNGGFYKAVILAKSLEKGGGNPLRGERKRDKARRRMGGFFNSSKFDKASDVMKLAGASTGALGAFDAKFKGSFVAQGISLVSNFMAFVTSFRGFINKIKQHRKLPKKSDKVFNVFGIITDGVTLLAKGAAIAKTIAGFAGKVNQDGTGVFGSIWDRVTLLLNSISQIGGLMGVSRGLHKSRENLTNMKNLEKGERKKVIDIVKKYNSPETEPAQDTDANQEGSSAPGEPALTEGERPAPGGAVPPALTEGERPAPGGAVPPALTEGERPAPGGAVPPAPTGDQANTGNSAGKRKSVKQKAREAKANRSERKETQKQASVLLYDARVSEEDKDQLAAYLALNRRIKNLRKGQASMAMGLLATLTAFGSSIAASVNNHNDEEKKGIKQAAAYMGVAASGMGIVATATGMGISDRHAKKMDTQETDTIKERLWHVIESVKSDDKYGLKKVEAEMDVLKAAKKNNTPLGAEAEGEIMTHAQTAKDKYASASGQFAAAGVNYKALFSVKDLREFKQGLISGI